MPPVATVTVSRYEISDALTANEHNYENERAAASSRTPVIG